MSSSARQAVSSAAAPAVSASASAPAAPAASSAAGSSAASSAATPAASSAASSSATSSAAASSSAAGAASSSSASASVSSSAASASASSSAAAPSSSSSASQAPSSSIASSSSSSRNPTSSSTTNTTSQSNMTSPNSPSTLSTGAIIGIVVGVVGGLIFIALLWRWCRRRKDNKMPKAPLPPPRDPTSMRQRAPGGSASGMNRASSYSTLLGPSAYAQSHSRQPSLSDSLPLHSGISSHHLQQKSSMSSLNKVDEHMPSPDGGLEAGAGIRPSPLQTPSDSSHGSRTNSPFPSNDFMPAYPPRQGPSSLGFGHHRPNSTSSLSSSAAGGSYGVTHTGKLVSVQMPKRLGAPKPDENGDFFNGNRGRVPSGIARWRDDLQAPSMNHHTRTPSTLSFNSPAVSSSEGSDSAEHGLRRER